MSWIIKRIAVAVAVAVTEIEFSVYKLNTSFEEKKTRILNFFSVAFTFFCKKGKIDEKGTVNRILKKKKMDSRIYDDPLILDTVRNMETVW